MENAETRLRNRLQVAVSTMEITADRLTDQAAEHPGTRLARRLLEMAELLRRGVEDAIRPLETEGQE